MKVLKIGILSYAEMKARTLAIARGELKPKPTDPRIWFPSAESLIRVLTERNRSLLAAIRESQPQSLTDLARLTGRQKSNLSRTLKTMERYGLVKLEQRAHGKVAPKVAYSGLMIEMPIERTS